MKNCLFISRHAPTMEQIQLAEKAGYSLIHGGDLNAFSYTLEKDMGEMILRDSPEIEISAIACVHPNIALAAINQFDVLIFQNINRAPEGEKPQFVVGGVTIWEKTFPRITNYHISL